MKDGGKTDGPNLVPPTITTTSEREESWAQTPKLSVIYKGILFSPTNLRFGQPTQDFLVKGILSKEHELEIDGEVKRLVSEQYTRCTELLTQHKQRLIDIADALLAREILDADQVRRLAYGHPLDEPPTADVPTDSTTPSKEKERASIVPPMEPIRKPLAQE